ncbi:GNAT family N-acetyltransferase [Crocosphaera chwakensis]|uniref:GCN5-related N-acetyltransferase n=1 Tax=Crocosphaera chwakensis CCY0110 TaxID=391612 RepID=A3IL62_9CHRO|nr:GNAT family N-acetyltransferase [Crocosphaera chwakensis]EAZ92931.1 GCN5-related N-acetyltransferase [Crocosphaera chwakensis CCY0110]
MSKPTIQIINYQENLEAIKTIRVNVFQQEQGVDPDLEFDGYDNNCLHFLAYLDGQSVGTARIRYLDESTAKIERLAVLSHARGQGIGTALMKQAIAFITEQKKYGKIIIHAQVYIQKLYEKLGFEPIGDRFTEGNILHIKMVKFISEQ